MRALIWAICLVCLASATVCFAQNTVIAAQVAPATDPQFGGHRRPDPEAARIEREMAKQRNKDRQQKLKEDTDKLLKLATELKEYVDKSNEQILSIEVLKKTDEIEKLAKSVRDKMKAGSYDGVPQ
ncbi:MAG TPA: hypothetical protein VG897_00020 [Terriglobales bacterium]|nr:hypothetical protein [Terriglobales bacterium]